MFALPELNNFYNAYLLVPSSLPYSLIVSPLSVTQSDANTSSDHPATTSSILGNESSLPLDTFVDWQILLSAIMCMISLLWNQFLLSLSNQTSESQFSVLQNNFLTMLHNILTRVPIHRPVPNTNPYSPYSIYNYYNPYSLNSIYTYYDPWYNPEISALFTNSNSSSGMDAMV